LADVWQPASRRRRADTPLAGRRQDRVNAHCARTRCHPSCQGRTPLSFKWRVRTVELARVANLIVGPAFPMDRRLTARVRALPSGPHRRCHLRRASGANCASGPHPARSASQTVACQKVGPITGVPRLAIRRTHSLSADSSHRRFARPRARHTRATRNRLELRYCWPRHPRSRRVWEADLTLPIRLLTSTATMMELGAIYGPTPRGHARRESGAGVLDQAPLWPGDVFRAKARRARPAIRIPNQNRARPLLVRASLLSPWPARFCEIALS